MELIIVLVVVHLIVGPKRLPGLGKQLGTGMREFKESITGKGKDDDDDDDDQDRADRDRDAFGEPARPARQAELDRSAAEPEVVTGEARREDQPASRADT